MKDASIAVAACFGAKQGKLLIDRIYRLLCYACSSYVSSSSAPRQAAQPLQVAVIITGRCCERRSDLISDMSDVGVALV